MTSPNDSRPAGAHVIQFADGDLNFRPISLSDPVPTGRQILNTAVGRTAESYSLFVILSDGEFEDIRLDETIDVRPRGEERFIGFETDRDYKFVIESSEMRWGKPLISGRILYGLAEADPETTDLYLQARGAENRRIRPNDVVKLDEPGIERFFLAPRETPGFGIVVLYNGAPAPQRVRPEVTLQAVLERALADFGHPAGGPVLFSEGGAELGLGQTVAQAGLSDGARLILRPRVVQGG
ncbi:MULTISPECIES: multiubiquitin domain-containing protein [Brevundimonas]|uniref:Multiubiquitin domain-containing protein n=1 Tax=Brevundimonas pondensis TaxID=2774189 RepID=A0ABX7SKQ6_9CAUL|nr:multiubiquitin domain-containing protein [Brevundimonas pondensis]QTC87475.1 multiubiquitin domain-containing protein [Brevundimonas pondensis]